MFTSLLLREVNMYASSNSSCGICLRMQPIRPFYVLYLTEAAIGIFAKDPFGVGSVEAIESLIAQSNGEVSVTIKIGIVNLIKATSL